MARKSGRQPSAQEKALWDRFTSNINRRDVSDSPDLGLTAPTPKAPAKGAAPKVSIPENFAVGARAKQVYAPPSQTKPTSSKLDQKLQKKLSRGKIEPEGRFDLHGMTLARAQPALNGFLLRSFTEGRRLVLVITGKGRERASLGPVPEQAGLLKRHVPIWLREGPMATIVQDVVPAHQRHGGSGAYYVYLRRRRD